MASETRELEERVTLLMKLTDRLTAQITQFQLSRTPIAKNPRIGARLEDNQQNLLKIIDNVGGMHKLFRTVAKEVKKVGDITKALPNFAQVNTLVG